MFRQISGHADSWFSQLLGEIGLPYAGPPQVRSLGGGCISAVYRVDAGKRSVAVKRGDAGSGAIFEAEAKGLNLLRTCPAVRVPAVLGHGQIGSHAYLALEFIAMTPGSSQAQLGQAVAALHQIEGPAFGLDHDNFLGATPQPNAWSGDWAAFFLERRLRHQLSLAQTAGLTFRGAEDLLERLKTGFPPHPGRPALLHGDLWSGNVAFDEQGTPVLYDPACYYGHPEADLAMAELFGGFGSEFFRSYHRQHPRSPRYDSLLRPLYQLYHLLNHHLLFGGGYRAGVEGRISHALAAL